MQGNAVTKSNRISKSCFGKALAAVLILLLGLPIQSLAEGLTVDDLVLELRPNQEVCGHDTDGNGALDGAGELIACQNGVCPFGAVSCDQQSQAPSCAAGFTWSAAGRCEAAPVCPGGGTYNASTDLCEVPVSISGGGDYGDNYAIFADAEGTTDTLHWWSRKWRGAIYTTFTGPSISVVGGAPEAELPISELRKTGEETVEVYAYGGEILIETISFGAPVRLVRPDGSETETLIPTGFAWKGAISSIQASGNRLTFSSAVGLVGHLELGKIEQAPDCLGGSLDASLDVCLTAEPPACPAGTTFSDAAGTCLAAATCPLGGQYVCAPDYRGQLSCSAQPCSILDPTTWTEDSADLTNYTDDGEVDENGTCSGQTLIFHGEAGECLNSSVRTSFSNCCAIGADQEVPDNIKGAGKAVSGAMTVYSVYKAYTALSTTAEVTSAAQALANSQAAFTNAEIAMNLGDTANAYTSTMEAAESFKAYLTGLKTAAATTNMISNVGSMVMQTLAAMGPMLILAAVMYLITNVLMKGCPESGMPVAMAKAAGRTHYIGSYCKTTSPIGCLQNAEVHCAFHSKLGRIIHEQGRWQIASFNPGGLPQEDPRSGGWGFITAPNCRGFTPDEFSMLDFGQIDMSEYFADVQKKAEESMQEMMPALEENIEGFMNETADDLTPTSNP